MSAAALNATPMRPAGPPGWYGKLPSLGDFASRRLPQSFVRTWDEWLQRGLAASEQTQALSGGDVAAHRFWVSHGLLDSQSWAGVLTPSFDRIGRRFPLTIAAPLGPDLLSLATALAARAWFAAIEAVVSRILDDRLTVDEIELLLTDVAARVSLTSCTDAAAERLAADLLQSLAATAQSTARTRRSDESSSYSVWWQGEASQSSDFLCTARLPIAASFDLLLGDTSSPEPTRSWR